MGVDYIRTFDFSAKVHVTEYRYMYIACAVLIFYFEGRTHAYTTENTYESTESTVDTIQTYVTVRFG